METSLQLMDGLEKVAISFVIRYHQTGRIIIIKLNMTLKFTPANESDSFNQKKKKKEIMVY